MARALGLERIWAAQDSRAARLLHRIDALRHSLHGLLYDRADHVGYFRERTPDSTNDFRADARNFCEAVLEFVR